MWLQEQSILFTVWLSEWSFTINCVTIEIVVYVLRDCAVSRDNPMVTVATCAVLNIGGSCAWVPRDFNCPPSVTSQRD